jgi:hypothetical protein
MGTPCAPKRKRERCSGPACTQCKTRPERTHAGYTPGVSPRLQALVSVQLTPMPPTPLTARCRLKTPSPTAPPAAWAAPLPSAASERCAYAAAAQGSGRVATARTSQQSRDGSNRCSPTAAPASCEATPNEGDGSVPPALERPHSQLPAQRHPQRGWLHCAITLS